MPVQDPNAENENIVSAQHPPSMRLTTKVQVSGWRFLLRRLEHAIVRRNTEMWDDPGRFYSRATMVGIVISVVICLAAALLAWLKPQGTVQGSELLADTTTNQLFILDSNSDTLRPVYNLTSGRLILGQPDDPRRVKTAELNRYRRAQTAGIPGAPFATPVDQKTTGYWTVCDTVSRAETSRPGVTVSVIGDEPVLSNDITELAEGQSALVTFRDNTYLVDRAGRHAIDLTNTAITAAIDLPPSAVTSIPISEALYNALPAAAPLALPFIQSAGDQNPFGLDPAIRIGTVITDTTADDKQFYVVLADGLAKINEVTASALRNTNAYGFVNPPALTADRIAAIPEREYKSPLTALSVIDRTLSPALCWAWEKNSTDSVPPTIRILQGRNVPVPTEELNAGIDQITANVTVYQHGGRFVEIIGPTNHGESQFYIDPTSVRYGMGDKDAAGDLGLSNPQPAPWAAIRLLASGPDLSKQAALLEHDTLPPDPRPRPIPAAGQPAPAVPATPAAGLPAMPTMPAAPNAGVPAPAEGGLPPR